MVFIAVVFAMDIVARYVANVFPITVDPFFVAMIVGVSCRSVMWFIMRFIMSVVLFLAIAASISTV